MKKTIKISLQGTVFHIDEDAYALLQQYLADIGEYFKPQEGAGEIIQDIEIRIAEIFTGRLAGKREVVSLEDVKHMISILGKPEDIFEGPGTAEGGYDYQPPVPGRKRLYRDPDNAVLGGVCGGLGAYFSVDPVWFRVLFILLTLVYGASLLAYLVMWIIIPEARTLTQRLEMEGEPVNISNISKNVGKEIKRVGENIKNIPRSEGYRRSRNALQELFHGAGQIILTLLKIIAVIIGVVLIVSGIIILVSLLSVFFFHYSQFFPELNLNPSYYLPDLLVLFTRPENVPYIIGTFVLTLGIPLVALIYAGIKIIFRLRTQYRAAGITLFVIWLISFISLGLFSWDIATNYAERARVFTSTKIELPSSDTLYVAADRYSGDPPEAMLLTDLKGIYLDRESKVVMGKPEIDIYYSDNVQKPELEIHRKARGNSRQAALKHCEDILFSYDIRGNHLILDPWFRAGRSWYAPEVDIRLRLPAGSIICLDENLRYLLDNVPNIKNHRSYNLAGKCWVMTEEGLAREEKDKR